MIRLRLMKEWFDRVDDRMSPLADRIARPWFDGNAVVRCGPASSNIVCRVTAEGQSYYLRCNREDERTVEEYAAEMAFVEHLAQNGIRVALPVPSRAGRVVETVSTELGVFNAVLLEEAPGQEIDLPDMDDHMLREWGGAMAALHNASAGYQGMGRPRWADHLTFAQDVISLEEEAAHSELRFVASALGPLDSGRSSFGLIHFDMETDNMRWQAELPAMFDFDDCARYPFAADVAFALRDLYHDRIDQLDLEDRRLRTFVEGYRSKRLLPQSELRLLALYVRAHNLYWFARLKRSIEEGEIRGEEPWTAELRARLVGTMDAYREDFQQHPVRDYLG